MRLTPVAYPRLERQKGASLGYALALPANIRLGGKACQGQEPIIFVFILRI
jgi:hypothetical protein